MAIFSYSLCSSTLLLFNKMVMQYIPIPSVVSFFQILFSACFLLAYKAAGGQIDALEWPKIKAYSIYILAFVCSIYANMQALNKSNVETVIVFRACTPLAVTIIEYFFMNRDFPSKRSSTSLLLVSFGAIIYCLTDSQFAMKGFEAYYWVLLYFILITFEMTYGKKLTSSVKMESVWGPVLYCNLLAAPPMFMIGYFSGDYENLREVIAEVPTYGMSLLFFSCIIGTLIG